METWYIKKADKVGLLKKVFNIITVQNIDNNKIIILPFENGKEIPLSVQERIAMKISRLMLDKQNQNIVLAQNIEESAFKETLMKENCKVLDGRWLFKYLMPIIINYVAEKQKMELEKNEVAVMTNDNSENNLKMFVDIASKIKMLNIITSDIDKFKPLEDYLIENYGIIIRVTNNRKKALTKSNIIINLDFAEEDFNKYSIPSNGVVVSIPYKLNIKSKRFNGININYYNLDLPELIKENFNKFANLNEFDYNTLFESTIYAKRTYDVIHKELKDMNIMHLIGNNGKIEESEYKQCENK
ncbi:MAG: hypothetical protein IKP28_00125 [Clostridia bacterium]|nr:hypothetical protein [Clostridia bacterium]